MKKRFENKGFTLLELLVVVGIIGAMATFGVFGYSSAAKAGRDAKRKSELKQYQSAVEVYAVKHNNTYPVYSSRSGVSIGTGNLCSAAVLNLSACPKDPQSPDKEYKYQSSADGSSYVLWAELEKAQIPTGGTNYFVVCSNGVSGIGLQRDREIPPLVPGVCPTLD